MGLGRQTKPLPKRRKLVASERSIIPVTLNVVPAQFPIKIPVCVTCSRTFNGRSQVVQCTRCRATTCLICSRTCSAPPPSLPPTPALTRSSTPTASPAPSPRRRALALSTNSASANTLSVSLPVEHRATGKRHKLDEEEVFFDDGKVVNDSSLRGCGRTLCRDCCYENPLCATTTCYDCLDHAYHPLMQ